jgi:hypothetical protein
MFGLRDEFLVQGCAPEADSEAMGKIGADCIPFSVEANSAKAETRLRRKADADAGSGGERVWHESLTASFIDRRAAAVREGHTEPFAPGGQGGRETRGSATDYENISIEHVN